jgi:hypothetical protein
MAQSTHSLPLYGSGWREWLASQLRKPVSGKAWGTSRINHV